MYTARFVAFEAKFTRPVLKKSYCNVMFSRFQKKNVSYFKLFLLSFRFILFVKYKKFDRVYTILFLPVQD